MQAAMAARNSSAGLKASVRPFTSVSRMISAFLQLAELPCASIRFATTSYSSMAYCSSHAWAQLFHSTNQDEPVEIGQMSVSRFRESAHHSMDGSKCIKRDAVL